MNIAYLIYYFFALDQSNSKPSFTDWKYIKSYEIEGLHIKLNMKNPNKFTMYSFELTKEERIELNKILSEKIDEYTV